MLAASLLLGVMVGYWIGAKSVVSALGSSASDQGPIAQAVNQSSSVLDEPLSDRVTLGGDSDEGESPDDAGEVQAVTVPVEMLEMLAGIRIQQPTDELFSSSDPLAEALSISDGEKAQLQRGYKKMLGQIKRSEASATEVLRNADGSVLLSVPAVRQERQKGRMEFSGMAQQILGDERASVLLAAKGGGSMFGADGDLKDYLVEKESAGDGTFRYRIAEIEGDQRKVYVGNAIPSHLRHLTDVADITPVLETLETDDED